MKVAGIGASDNTRPILVMTRIGRRRMRFAQTPAPSPNIRPGATPTALSVPTCSGNALSTITATKPRSLSEDSFLET